MSGRRSRQKGARGEREAAAVLGEVTGHEWRRSASQAQAGAREPDVVSDAIPGEGPEVKRGKRVSLWAALRQATEDSAQHGRIPWVLAREDRGEWVVLVRLSDLRALARLLWGGR